MNKKELITRWLLPLIFFMLLILANESYEASYSKGFQRRFQMERIKVKEGDNLIWKENHYDDSNWKHEFPSPPSFYWWRVTINIDDEILKGKPLGLGIWSYLGSYELYWDGVKIGENGMPAIDKTEKAGNIDKVFYLPDSLITKGKHLISARASQQYATSVAGEPFILLRNYDLQTQGLIIQAVFIHIFAGMFIIIAVYYFLVYFQSYRQLIFLIFGTLCILFFLNVILSYVKFYYKYPYPLFINFSSYVKTVVILISVLIPIFYLNLFKIPRKIIWYMVIAGCYSIFFLLSFKLDVLNYHYIIGASLVSLPFIVWANSQRLLGSTESLYGIMSLVTILFYHDSHFYYNIVLIMSFTILVFFNLLLLSKIMGQQHKLFNEIKERNSRLKLELIRKNIQPHYIMNTLTSLISWVEESPKIAVKFIEALAKEFELLNTVAERKQISIIEEIKLCKSHMEIMSYRNEEKYELVIDGIDEKESIPPAIFLNLVENGITHNIHEAKVNVFSMVYTENGEGKSYKFLAPGKTQESVYNKNDARKKQVKDGNGLKYIKARLQESYGSHWELKSYSDSKGWVTEILILKRDR